MTVPIPSELSDIVRLALQEDIGSGDLTAGLIPADTVANATVISRQEAVIAGIPWFNEVFKQIDPSVQITWQVSEGSQVVADQVLCQLQGTARSLLTGERSALNFLQLLSATATQTRRYADAVAGTQAQVLDTRKTIPCLRTAQKYAVRCGGGMNHRIGLFDAFLIKENHIMAAGSVSAALQAAQQMNPQQVPVIIEVETLDQVQEALNAGAVRLLLDNFSLPMLREAVALVGGRAKLEASGGVDLGSIRAIAETGVDFISIGSLTKDVEAVDLSMRMQG